MLAFPNGGALAPPAWVGNSVGNYFTLRWRMGDAFEHSKTLVNALAGEETFFDEFLYNLEHDSNGPRVNLRRDLIHHLGQHVTFIGDTTDPITPQSERFLVAIEVLDTAAVAQTIAQALQDDPSAERLQFGPYVVWQIVNKEPDIDDLSLTVEVEGPGFDFGTPHAQEVEEEEAPPTLPQSAIAVAGGRLLISSHAEYIAGILQQQAVIPLAGSADYARVSLALEQLGAGNEAFRLFSRSDETYRATYELLRQGRIDESQSLLARLLNRMRGEAGPRKQKLDGSTLPDFEYVRRYLGPAGVFIESHGDGWMVSGCLLSQESD
jgi:hypothetical protein